MIVKLIARQCEPNVSANVVHKSTTIFHFIVPLITNDRIDSDRSFSIYVRFHSVLSLNEAQHKVYKLCYYDKIFLSPLLHVCCRLLSINFE